MIQRSLVERKLCLHRNFSQGLWIILSYWVVISGESLCYWVFEKYIWCIKHHKQFAMQFPLDISTVDISISATHTKTHTKKSRWTVSIYHSKDLCGILIVTAVKVIISFQSFSLQLGAVYKRLQSWFPDENPGHPRKTGFQANVTQNGNCRPLQIFVFPELLEFSKKTKQNLKACCNRDFSKYWRNFGLNIWKVLLTRCRWYMRWFA